MKVGEHEIQVDKHGNITMSIAALGLAVGASITGYIKLDEMATESEVAAIVHEYHPRLDQRVGEIEDTQRLILKEQYRAQITSYQTRICSFPNSPLMTAWIDELNRLLNAYRMLEGESFPRELLVCETE